MPTAKDIRSTRRGRLLSWMWAVYYGLTFSVGRYERWKRPLIWGGGGVVAGSTALLLRNSIRKIPQETALVAGFLSWCLLGSFSAQNAELFWAYFRLVAQFGVLVALIGMTIRAGGHPTPFWWSFLGVSAFLAGNARWTEAAPVVVGPDVYKRVSGLTDNPNALGFQCSSGIIAAMGIYGPTRSKLIRIVCVLGAVTAFYGLVVSASRGAYLALVTGASLWMLLCMNAGHRRKVSTLVAFLIGAALLYGLVTWIQEDTYLGRRMARAGEEVSRRELVVEGLKIAAQHPILGVGLGQFGSAVGTGQYAHNEWVELLATTGIPGFLMIFGLYLSAWRRLKKAIKHTRLHPVKYHANFARVFILVLLEAGAIFRPNILSIDTMFLIAITIGIAHWTSANALTPCEKEHDSTASRRRLPEGMTSGRKHLRGMS